MMSTYHGDRYTRRLSHGFRICAHVVPQDSRPAHKPRPCASCVRGHHTMLSARHSLAGAQLQCGPAPRLRRSSGPTRSAPVAKLTKDGPHVAIVGTTGAVGQEFLNVSARVAGRAARRLAVLVCLLWRRKGGPTMICRAACACF